MHKLTAPIALTLAFACTVSAQDKVTPLIDDQTLSDVMHKIVTGQLEPYIDSCSDKYPKQREDLEMSYQKHVQALMVATKDLLSGPRGDDIRKMTPADLEKVKAHMVEDERKLRAAADQQSTEPYCATFASTIRGMNEQAIADIIVRVIANYRRRPVPPPQ